MDLGEKDHSGKVLFSLLTIVDLGQPAEVVVARCLHCKVSRPLSLLYSLKGSLSSHARRRDYAPLLEKGISTYVTRNSSAGETGHLYPLN